MKSTLQQLIFFNLLVLYHLTTVSALACLDRSRSCRVYVKRGFCKETSKPHNLRGWTRRNCKLSCQICPQPTKPDEALKVVVKDILESVASLYGKENGCRDQLRSCKRYKSLGYCYHSVIREYCKVSCKVCYPPYVPVYWNCKDTDTSCKLFAYNRKCNNGRKADKDFGRRNCRFSCGYCRRPKTVKCGKPKKPAVDIVGGTQSTSGHHPWQVAIYFSGELRCGGTLFNERYVLTAAHCFHEVLDRLELFKVVLGEHDRDKFEGREQQLGVQRIILHKEYDRATQQNDIALLNLDGYADLSQYIDLMCLPDQHEEVKTGTNCTITGWGNVFNMAAQSATLQEITVPIVSQTSCKRRNVIGSLRVTDNMLCTGFADGMTIKSACKGDSGGPLSCTDAKGVYKVYGVVSWGSTQCNALEHFNVFTKVSAYVKWVQKQLATFQ